MKSRLETIHATSVIHSESRSCRGMKHAVCAMRTTAVNRPARFPVPISDSLTEFKGSARSAPHLLEQALAARDTMHERALEGVSGCCVKKQTLFFRIPGYFYKC